MHHVDEPLCEDPPAARRLKDQQLVSRTGMAILDVALLSGFRFPAVAGAPSELIRKVEIRDERVVFYLDSVSNLFPRLIIMEKRVKKKNKEKIVTGKIYIYILNFIFILTFKFKILGVKVKISLKKKPPKKPK